MAADAERAAVWIAQALQSSGYRVDFSVHSLSELDRFFDEQAPNGGARLDGLLASDLGARLFAAGAYVGEVIRRAAGGRWRGSDLPDAEIDIALVLPDGSEIWPVQRVMKRFQLGAQEGLLAYAVAVTGAGSSSIDSSTARSP